ncbi:hypothetical protein PTE30175_05449 [Pandoraea terrae]|uniref:Uncharacterized protein n=1 Tax=Pandoraea terrae TaxID=1537710 RepID=A0A5E4ZEW8_9BURK|nr:hypothetical protein PTE30175_05449 [Pandoraea terrae]
MPDNAETGMDLRAPLTVFYRRQRACMHVPAETKKAAEAAFLIGRGDGLV